MPESSAYVLILDCDDHAETRRAAGGGRAADSGATRHERMTFQGKNREAVTRVARRLGWESYGTTRGKNKRWRCPRCCRTIIREQQAEELSR